MRMPNMPVVVSANQINEGNFGKLTFRVPYPTSNKKQPL